MAAALARVSNASSTLDFRRRECRSCKQPQCPSRTNFVSHCAAPFSEWAGPKRLHLRSSCFPQGEASLGTAAQEERKEVTSKYLQGQNRAQWAESVRQVTGRRKHQVWEPHLDPPPLLAQVCVVLVGPKRPVSVGTVARALSCFECMDLRVVQPRCSTLQRSARSASKGGQYLLYRQQEFADVSSAVADCQLSVAFARWSPSASGPLQLTSLSELTSHPVMQMLLTSARAGATPAAAENTGSGVVSDVDNVGVTEGRSQSKRQSQGQSQDHADPKCEENLEGRECLNDNGLGRTHGLICATSSSSSPWSSAASTSSSSPDAGETNPPPPLHHHASSSSPGAAQTVPHILEKSNYPDPPAAPRPKATPPCSSALSFTPIPSPPLYFSSPASTCSDHSTSSSSLTTFPQPSSSSCPSSALSSPPSPASSSPLTSASPLRSSGPPASSSRPSCSSLPTSQPTSSSPSASSTQTVSSSAKAPLAHEPYDPFPDSVAGHDLQSNSHLPPPVRVALVFGREEAGLTDAEVAACNAVCSIPIGRLQESLSLSHAVTLALSHIFSEILDFMPLATRHQYRAQSRQHLASGWSDVGVER